MRPIALIPLLALAALAGCSEGSSLSTSSIFGGSTSAPAAPSSTPTSRAFQVGSTAARAAKCGYNFDSNKLRASFLAYEASQTPGQDQANVVTTYDTAYTGVTKATGQQSGYCTDAKTREIKAALNRHLAGDYSPDAPKPEPVEEGLFSGWGSGSSTSSYKQTLPTDNSND